MSNKKRIDINFMVPSVVAIFLLYISFLNFPMGFYVLLRFVMMGASIFYIYTLYNKQQKNFWFWFFIFMCFLYNPFVSFDKEIWLLINNISAILMGFFLVNQSVNFRDVNHIFLLGFIIISTMILTTNLFKTPMCEEKCRNNYRECMDKNIKKRDSCYHKRRKCTYYCEKFNLSDS